MKPSCIRGGEDPTGRQGRRREASRTQDMCRGLHISLVNPPHRTPKASRTAGCHPVVAMPSGCDHSAPPGLLTGSLNYPCWKQATSSTICTSTAAFRVLKSTLWGRKGHRFASQLLQTLALIPCSADCPTLPAFPQAAEAGWDVESADTQVQALELKRKSRCLETRRHQHPSALTEDWKLYGGEGRKGSAAWINLIPPGTAAQKLQTQKEKRHHFHLWRGPEALASSCLFTWE